MKKIDDIINNYLKESKDVKDVLSFCKKHCKKLTNYQEVIVKTNLKKFDFWGVAKPIGGGDLMPAFIINNKLNVINKQGYQELASQEGTIKYEGE